MSDGFPLLTTKKMAWKTMVTELLWFLRGDTNIKFLLDYNCHIWDGDAYKNYINKEHLSMSFNFLTQEEFINKIKTDDEFAKKWGVKVEVRELSSVQERKKYDIHFDDLIGEYEDHHITLDKRGVPRKIITITYNNETIESYE